MGIPARVVEKQREFGFRGACCARKMRELRSMYDTGRNAHAPLFSLRGSGDAKVPRPKMAWRAHKWNGQMMFPLH